MPRYQYACTVPECGHEFEATQSFSDPALTVCPQCSGRLRKVFSAVGVVFKGSGFYRTDSRSEAKSKAGSAKTETKADSTPKTDSATANGSSSNGSSGSSGSSSSSTSAGTAKAAASS